MPPSFSLGPDRLTSDGDRLTIDAAHPFPEWQPSAHRPTVVLFQDQEYRLLSATPGPGGRIIYALERWSVPQAVIPGHTDVYDLERVMGRDRGRRSGRLVGAAAWLLVPLSPVLGFLWSGPKETLRRLAGLNPALATSASLWSAYVVALALLGVCGLFVVLTGGEAWTVVGILVGFGLGLDAVVRHQALRTEEHRALGLGEWLFR